MAEASPATLIRESLAVMKNIATEQSPVSDDSYRTQFHDFLHAMGRIVDFAERLPSDRFAPLQAASEVFQKGAYDLQAPLMTAPPQMEAGFEEEEEEEEEPPAVVNRPLYPYDIAYAAIELEAQRLADEWEAATSACIFRGWQAWVAVFIEVVIAVVLKWESS